MPTLVTVPATTGPKSHDTGPDVLLKELWAEHTGARPKTNAIAISPRNGLEAVLAVNLSSSFALRSGVGIGEAGSVDMVSPEE